MECISCQSVIDPKWKHAIEKNICPNCGDPIMPEDLKSSLTVLREIMTELQTYPEQLNDWLLSNYQYIKTDNPNIVQYISKDLLKEVKKNQDQQSFQERKKSTVKIQTDSGIEEVEVEKIQSEDQTNVFFERAEGKGIGKSGRNNESAMQSLSDKTARLKEMAQQIKKAGSTGIIANGNSINISPEMLENADPEVIEDYQSMISGTGEENIPSFNGNNDEDDGNMDYVLSANLAAAGRGGGNNNASDLAKLQKMRSNVNKAKQNFNGGGGSFSRG